MGSQPTTSRTSLATSRSKEASGETDEDDASASESTLLTVLETLQDGTELHQTMSRSSGSLDYPLDRSFDSIKDRSLVRSYIY